MGGQACVFYGAAEFSRDTDLLILATIESGTGAAAPFGPIQVSDRQKSVRWASAHAEESQQVHGQREGVLSCRSSPYMQLCI
jgi:hypothetical protein